MNALFLSVITDNNPDHVEVDGYGDIATNYETSNIIYIINFISVFYNLQEEIELDINKLASGYLVCNSICTYPG